MSVARVFKAATPYNVSELADIDYAQSFDVVYLAHLDHAPGRLTRTAHTEWSFASVNFQPVIGTPTGVGVTVTNPNTDAGSEPPGNAYFPQPARYVVTAINDETGQESRPSASASGTNDLSLKRNKNTIAWSAVTDATRYRVYKAENEGGFGFIGETTGTSFTDDNIDGDTTDGPPEAYNPFSLSNYPSTVTFFEQRLMWGRTRTSPNALFSSRSADFENMDVSRPGKEDDAISMRIQAQKVNAVHWLVPLDELLALTGDGVFVVRGANQDYLTASPPPLAKRQSGRGARRLKPLVLDEVTFFQPALGAEVRSLGFTYEIDGYRSNDVSIFSPGLFRDRTIVAWAYAEEPLSIIVAVMSDGKALCFTWQAEQQVWGWTEWITDGFIEDVCVIPEGGESRIYWTVRRTIAGVERRFIERLASAKWQSVEVSCFIDCALSFVIGPDDEPTSRFQVPHLAGRTVNAIADGFAINDMVVDADGWVDLGYEVQRIASIGLPFAALVETLPLVPQTNQGSTRDKRQMIGDAVLQVADTRIGGVEAGRRLSRLYPIKARTDEALGDATRLATGAVSASTEPLTAGESTYFIRSAEALPFTLTAAYLDPLVTEN